MTFIIILATILESFLARVDTTLFETDYRITISESRQIPTTINGHLTMRGELFRATIFEDEVAYDGHTLYIYRAQDNELTLTEPTADELSESNPLLMAKKLVASQQIKTTGGETTGIPSSLEMRDGNHQYRLELLHPTFVTHSSANDSSTSSFTLSKSGAYINDMR